VPKPTMCVSDALRQFLEIFRPCFSRRHSKCFVTVLLGLVECEARSTFDGEGYRLRERRDARQSPHGLGRSGSAHARRPGCDHHRRQLSGLRDHSKRTRRRKSSSQINPSGPCPSSTSFPGVSPASSLQWPSLAENRVAQFRAKVDSNRFCTETADPGLVLASGGILRQK